MQGWLEREIADVGKALELRIREAACFVMAYARGEISADEAAERGYDYSCRWGEALPGVPRSQNMTDEEILARVDEARVKQGFLDRHVSGRRGQNDGRLRGQ